MGDALVAQMIPNLTDRQIKQIPSSAEQRVYCAIANKVSDNCLVVHSLEFIKENKNNQSHSDREADFVVFSPEHGILVIEVKGGGIEYDKTSNQWHSTDRAQVKHEIKNPVKQAKDAKYEIARHMKRELGNKQIVLAHCALFPDLLDASPISAPEMPSTILGGAEDLKNIDSWIEGVFSYWRGQNDFYEGLGIQGIRAAEKLFGKSVSVRPSLKIAIEQENEIQLNLTSQQKNILRQLKRRKQAIVEGGAGTGKTILALDHAVALGQQGLKVLLLCYNKNLGNLLKQRVDGIENVYAMSFHEFCSWRIRQVKQSTGRDLINESKLIYPKDDLYDVLMPDALMNSLDIVPLKFDVIIVDEGQDFRAEYWLAIELLMDNSNAANFYIFHDSNQAIYTTLEQLPIDEEPLYLLDNCRNTNQIHSLCYQYYKGVEIDPPRLNGAPVTWFAESNTHRKQATQIDKLVHDLINTEQIDPEDIAVITIGNFSVAQEELQNSRHSQCFSFKVGVINKVLVDTAKRFKGLESKLMILWILDREELSNSLLYVAISRARLRLWIVCQSDLQNQIIQS
tara:strand:+ start:13726 stop:15426 length:1701 start_codon:yes stop_codon:yes gene_type:complete